MDQIRSFAANNRGGIINVLYVVAFLIVLYYIYKFLIQGSDLEFTALNVQTDANAPGGVPLPRNKTDLRVKQGGEYTLSFWMYISNWDYRSGLAKSVVSIVDTKAPNHTLFTSVLYPNEPKMMIRVHTGATTAGETDYTNNANLQSLLSGSAGNAMFAPSINTPMCDLQDIDLQRYINVTVSANGRIVDVYYDGKLTRSCILPDIPTAPDGGMQAITWGNAGGFGGKISGIQFFAYALTPDRIYAIYQAGPSSQSGLLGYMSEKLGINVSYGSKSQ